MKILITNNSALSPCTIIATCIRQLCHSPHFLALFCPVLTLCYWFPASYIHVCGAKNPNLNQCIINSVNALAPVLEVGIPELNIPPANPFEIETLPLADLPNFKAIGHNIKVYGLSTYKIKSLQVDLENQYLTIDLQFDDIHMLADYDLEARILIPIQGKGPISMNARRFNREISRSLSLFQAVGSVQSKLYPV